MKEQVARADPEKADSDKLLAGIREKSKQRTIRLNVEMVSQNRAERLTRSLVAESVNAVDAVVRQLVDGAISRVPQGLERAY